MPGLTAHSRECPDPPINIDPGRMSGAPCFAGTRVTLDTLFFHLESGGTVDSFVEGYEWIPREQVVAVVDVAREMMMDAGALEQRLQRKTRGIDIE